MTKCQVIGCENEAEYYDEFSGHCGDLRRVRVKVCKKHIIEGWVINREDREKATDEILAAAERIEAEYETCGYIPCPEHATKKVELSYATYWFCDKHYEIFAPVLIKEDMNGSKVSRLVQELKKAERKK